MLTIQNIDVFYGQVQALHGVSLEVQGSEIVSIIGANGAGKTTLIQAIIGVNSKTAGTIAYEEQDITKLPTHTIISKGITCVPEGRRIFPKLTVLENLEMGAYPKKQSKQQFQEKVEEVYQMFPRLGERKGQLGGTLSGGEQQMLAIGRALMNDPKILLLDEPSLGLAPIIVDNMFEIIQDINKKRGIPILLVEQNAYSALEISSRTYVLELGRVIKYGESAELLNDPDIIKAYLGG